MPRATTPATAAPATATAPTAPTARYETRRVKVAGKVTDE